MTHSQLKRRLQRNRRAITEHEGTGLHHYRGTTLADKYAIHAMLIHAHRAALPLGRRHLA